MRQYPRLYLTEVFGGPIAALLEAAYDRHRQGHVTVFPEFADHAAAILKYDELLPKVQPLIDELAAIVWKDLP